MKFFAMIDGRQVGPIALEDIVEAGVRPDTYVWAKGMSDWAHASDVPDICRFFRLRLAGVLPSQGQSYGVSQAGQYASEQAEQEEQEELIRQLPPMAQNLVRKSGIKLRKEDLPRPAQKPDSKWLPIIIYSICIMLILIGFLLMKL